MDANLYFLFSKIIDLVLSPSALFFAALGLGFVLVLTPLTRLGKWLLALAVLGYFTTAVLPGGYLLVNLLEERFPQPQLSRSIDGIIVLGGSFDTQVSAKRPQVALNQGAERLTEFVKLARVHPNAKLAFSGGIGLLSGRGMTEATLAKQFFAEMGLNVERIMFEDRSRNTSENAQLSYSLLQPQGQRWVLVTSASHMPRAMGLFRKAGWNIQAYPVDFLTRPSVSGDFEIIWPGNLDYIEVAVHEWGGLFVSWLRGSIDEPFPGPEPVAQVSN